jgi:hypothetical protein
MWRSSVSWCGRTSHRRGAPGDGDRRRATRLITNNRRDFQAGIAEIDITYPEALDVR